MAVEITTSPAFRAGNPQPLGFSPTVPVWDSTAPVWDFTSDGKRFFALTPTSPPQPYTVILNWQAGLKK